jgi:uracil-DNA glycosylase family 4
MKRPAHPLEFLAREVVACERCPRLRRYCARVAREKKAAYRDWEYWGRPVPGFGDPQATLLIVGLAPAAHGGNRTGRVFTGDRSGDFLYAALYRAGYANQPESRTRDDGLQLAGAYIAAGVRCAPPGNKPLPSEVDNCVGYLERELELLSRLRAILTLGRIGHDSLIKALRRRDLLPAAGRYPFGHGVVHELPPPLPAIVCSYHVSQQNTFTGRLTERMFDDVLKRASTLARLPPGATL